MLQCSERELKMADALIIGCSGIGCFWDSPTSPEVLTHAHGLYLKKFQLHFFDLNPERAREAATLWKGEVLASLGALKSYDVVVVCSPTKTHGEVLSSIKDWEIKKIICEKPFCESMTLAQSVLDKISDDKILVNYSRIFHSDFQKLKLQITLQEFGKPVSFQGTYSKGLNNNGSHMVSLLTYFFGEVQNVKKIFDYKEQKSGFRNVDVWIDFGGIRGFLGSFDETFYSVWELKIFFEKGNLVISDFGKKIQFFDLVRDKDYPEYTVLNLDPSMTILPNLNGFMTGLYGELDKPNGSTHFSLENSLAVHEFFEKITEK